MKILKQAAELNAVLQPIRLNHGCIGLVPTMGNLHSGHLELVAQAKQRCTYVLATIFVNPLQFGPNEDYERYPRTFTEDCQRLSDAGCDAVFVPGVAEMYPDGVQDQTTICVPVLSELHCGASRPGHFSGVCTVVNKLFNLTRPDLAFFGAKDYQQLLIIKKMVTDLCMPITVVSVAIQRSESGLALSSRNSFLSEQEKTTAAQLYACLQESRDEIIKSQPFSYTEIEAVAKARLAESGMQVDYFTICNATTLRPATAADKELVILSAAYLGLSSHKTRLIDNITLTLPSAI